METLVSKGDVACKPGKLFNDRDKTSNRMGNVDNNETVQKKKRGHSLIESFIKKNSGEYKRKKIWSVFSEKMTYKEYTCIIDDLRKSGKIAIDRAGYVVWIWYPGEVKEHLSDKNLIF